MNTKLNEYNKHYEQCERCDHLVFGICEKACHVNQIHETWPIDDVEIDEQCEEFLAKET